MTTLAKDFGIIQPAPTVAPLVVDLQVSRLSASWHFLSPLKCRSTLL